MLSWKEPDSSTPPGADPDGVEKGRVPCFRSPVLTLKGNEFRVSLTQTYHESAPLSVV